MPSGSTIKIFAARIHKSNAQMVLEESNESVNYLTSKLIAIAFATPDRGVEAMDELIREVEEIISELRDATFRKVCADNIICFPEDCDDELEGCAECGQNGFHKMSCGSKEAG